MGDFIVGGKWYLLGGWVANLKGSDPEIYKKTDLKTKKLFQNLFQRWCLISTFNCPHFCNSFFTPSSRGRLAQLQEGAVAAQCFGRGFPSPGGMCWVLVPELTGLPWSETGPSVTICSRQRWPHPTESGVTPWMWPLALCIPQPEQPSHHAVSRGGTDLGQPVWHQAPLICLWEHCWWSWHSWRHDQQPSHLGWWWLSCWHPRGSVFGDQGQLPCGDNPWGSPSWVKSCAPQSIREGGRIWVVLELKADLGVVQPENMDVCTVSPSENKYR